VCACSLSSVPGTSATESLVINKRQITIHGSRGTVVAFACDQQCLVCRAAVYWSGDDEGIFRVSISTCIVYEVCQEFILEIKENKSPAMYTFWKRRMQLSLSPNIQFMSLPSFQASFWSLTRALDIDYQKSFTCEFGCGNLLTAPIIVGDAKELLCHPARHKQVFPVVIGFVFILFLLR